MTRKTCLVPFLFLLSGALHAQEHLNTLWPPRGRTAERFGFDIDSDGKRLAVSTLRRDGPGLVYVYHREGANWIEDARLSNRTDKEFDVFDDFGWRVEISGTRVVSPAREKGELHVFEEQGDRTWSRTVIPAPDPVHEYAFGEEVQLDGDTLVAATYTRATGMTDAVYVFEAFGGTWTQTARLGEMRVRDMRLEGDTLVLAAELPVAGALVYTRAGTDWLLAQTIPTPFVPQLSLDGDVLAVTSGDTTFYERVGADWQAQGTLTGPGYPLEVHGKRTYMGRFDNVARQNTIEVHERDGSGNWLLAQKLYPPLEGTLRGSGFGGGMTFCGSEVILSDSSWSGSALGSGAVVTFSFDQRATLTATPQHVSLVTGGEHRLLLDAGVEHAGRRFVLRGSLAGTKPTAKLGQRRIPLRRESLYYPFSRRAGVLDGLGRAEVTLTVPPLGPELAHQTLHHAFVVLERPRGILHTSTVALGALNHRVIE